MRGGVALFGWVDFVVYISRGLTFDTGVFEMALIGRLGRICGWGFFLFVGGVTKKQLGSSERHGEQL